MIAAQDHGTTYAGRIHLTDREESMATATRSIEWQRDVDAALADAERTSRPLLLDFTAAPQ
jgi:hypothetical protein